jgi:hypothetical protein
MWLKIRSLFTALCPNCGFRQGVRKQRDSWDRLLSLMGLYPFQCRTCNKDFRAFGSGPPK